MFWFTPRFLAQSLLSTVNVKLSLTHVDRIPQDIPAIVVSNHRSFLDAPILIWALPYPLRIACHHYMGETPIMREAIDLLGCFPLAKTKQRQQQFFERANHLLTPRQWVGLFPEGTKPMIEPPQPHSLGKFQRGFAHLAWRSPVTDLVVLPVAIASIEETIYPTFPVRWLSNFDPEEPFFNRDKQHPMIVYHRANISIGHPYWINPDKKREYKGKQAKKLVTNLTEYCQNQISELLDEGCY